MSEERPGPEELPEEERLSRTLTGSLASGLQGLATGLGGLSSALAGAGIVGIVVGVVLLIFISDLEVYANIIMGLGGGVLALSMVISYRTVGRAVTGRQGRYSVNTVIMVAAFIGIAGVLNFLAFENTKRVDVTATNQFSLASRTVDLLENLDEKVEAKAFFVPGRSLQEEASLGVLEREVRDLLREFDIKTGKFSYEFVDPVVDPLVATEYEITEYPTVAFESLESERRHNMVLTTRALEADFVTGLLIVTGQEQKQVYSLEGHGERRLDNAEEDKQLGLALGGILRENYAFSVVSLNTTEGKETLVPEEDPAGSEKKPVSMLVVVAPEKDLLEGESEILDEYLRRGGKMLFLAEPGTPPTFRDFLARWGIVVGQGHIVDRQRSLRDNPEIIFLARDQYVAGFIPDAIGRLLEVDDVTARLDTTYYPGVTSLAPPEEGVVFFPPTLEPEEDGEDRREPTIVGAALGFTSPESWLIEDPTQNDPPPGVAPGLFYPAVALRGFGPLDEEPPDSIAGLEPASLIVFGDADFASNRYFFDASNSDIFLNSVNWLVGDIALADIRPKPFAFRELVLTPNEFNFMRYSSWFLLPILMALMGGFVWWKRR